jgi:PhnB protein
VTEREQVRTSNRTMPMCTVIPELVYEDVGEAIDWLCDKLGFAVRWRAGDHRAQLSFAGGTVAITEPRTSKALTGRQSLMVRVHDAHAHHDRARDRAATVIQAPEDFPYGERQYTVEDLGGHHWTFSQSIADLAPEAWGGITGPALEAESRPPSLDFEQASASDAAISVMLIVPDARAAVAWYEDALGATRLWDLGGVAGLIVGGAPFFLHEVNRENPAETSPAQAGVTSTRIEVFLDDPDGFIARAIAAGATGGSKITDHEMPWGTHRQGGFQDPFGHKWSVGDRSPLRSYASRGRPR